MKDGVVGGAKRSTDAAHIAATKVFAERLNALISEFGTSDRALAHAAGVTPQAVRSWKGGGNMPYGKRLRQVADFFGVSVDYLTGVWTPRKKREPKKGEGPPAGELFDGGGGAEDVPLRVDLDERGMALLRKMSSIRKTAPEQEAARILEAELEREWALLGGLLGLGAKFEEE